MKTKPFQYREILLVIDDRKHDDKKVQNEPNET